MNRTQTLTVLGGLLVVAGYGLVAALWIPRSREELPDHDAEAIQACAACLPPEVTLVTRFARYGPGDDKASQGSWRPEEEIISVRARLVELGASPRNGVIYASDGQPVLFYSPTIHRYSTAGWGAEVQHLIALQDPTERAARRHQGHVVALHPTSADAHMDPDYLKRFAAQPVP